MSNARDTQALGQLQQQSMQAASLDYLQPIGLLDDVFTVDGQVKPQWQYLLGSLRNLGPQVMAEREQKTRRILRDDGATFNIYGRADNPSTSWELDPVPHIVGSEDWGQVEAGLLERSELFNLILRDIYGPRTLVSKGVLPAEALFSHGGFVRACQGIQLPGEHELIMHAVDMVRLRDGSMCALSDRTQSPSGAGYVLENRTVMSRVFPSLYRDSHVHRLATFYQRLRLKLVSLSPSGEIPLIAVLTPGSHNETYFEHAYLANYMGFPLVQSGDLVVRGGFVWMKSLDGLKRVDVLLRQVEDAFCDPVELRSNSQLGVPGLLEVVRSGRVVLANPLGSGVLENPILLKYLPGISKYFLGREPQLASVKTYWCGDDSDLAFVTANLNQLIVKPAYRGVGVSSVWGGDLNPDQQKELLATIRNNRYQYVAQERLEKPHIPAFCEGRLESRPALLRTFAVAAASSYTVLPGGLTRIGRTTEGMIINMQSGSPSKDTWVTASEPERALDFDRTDESPRTHSDSQLVSLPSRVVENLYWMGRYAERAEVSLRFLRTVFLLLNGEDLIEHEARAILLRTVSQITASLPGFTNASGDLLANPDEELLSTIKGNGRIGSIKSTLNSMLSSADESRELFSTDTIRVVNDLRDALEQLDIDLADGLTSAPEDALDPLVTALAALSGLMQESMIRNVGWRFMELGKRIERALQTINTVKNLMTPVSSEAATSTLLTALLISMEAFMTYRRGGRERKGLELGLELVLLDNSNPRSLIFQLERLQEHLEELPNADLPSGELQEDERALLEAVTSLKLSRISTLLEDGTEHRDAMKLLLEHLEEMLKNFSRVISLKHFEHRTDSQQLVVSQWGTR